MTEKETKDVQITASRSNGTTVIAVSGDIGTEIAAPMNQRICDLLAGRATAALDMSGARCRSDDGLRIMLTAFRYAQHASTRLGVVGLTPELRLVVDQLGLVPYLTVADDLASCARSLRSSVTRTSAPDVPAEQAPAKEILANATPAKKTPAKRASSARAAKRKVAT